MLAQVKVFVYNTNMSGNIVKHWVKSSDENLDAMKSNFNSAHYDWALFIGHLVLEKLLKAIYAKRNPSSPHAPKLHDLIKLGRLCGLELCADTIDKLGIINTFNIEARYDDFKQEFRKLCTKEFAKEQIEIIEEVREWLLQELTKI